MAISVGYRIYKTFPTVIKVEEVVGGRRVVNYICGLRNSEEVGEHMERYKNDKTVSATIINGYNFIIRDLMEESNSEINNVAIFQ